MKKSIIYIFLISFLLQSCYSYKNIDLNKTPLLVGKKYKIKKDNKFVKASLVVLNDSIANFKMGREEKQISLVEIKEIKVRKVDPVKITSLVVFPLLIVLLIGDQLSKSRSWEYNPKGNTSPM
ncbi:hypothetical protein [Flavobacterium sp.]|uniref:hypothetical protein n=1 Tax=Flavobacterium sp. TaxID=239 RepID=UPI00374DEE23